MKDYNTVTKQLNSKSWQLKRIALALESANLSKQPATTQPLNEDASRLTKFLEGLDK